MKRFLIYNLIAGSLFLLLYYCFFYQETETQWKKLTKSGLGKKLYNQLRLIKNFKRREKNTYVYWDDDNGHFVFNENLYNEKEFPDTEYRLLCVSRYWNIIEYFYPSKYLLDEDWDKV